ncbi:uncharacterized protein SCHCODRAFT_02621634 [Schizophyllum commune H4-8]|nr:uncharacterized protein SCHCODRAFT_02621634 [Schizophyllum commune H4-8]KAI5893376.1 hypothetical protein SCHCODRAFT_02621634 [Schizophyllum commune H4-8]
MAARYPSSNASTPSGGSGAGLELVHTSCSPKRVPPVARRPRTYLRAPQEGPFTLRNHNKEVLVGRKTLISCLSGVDPQGYILSKLGMDLGTTFEVRAVYNRTKVLAAFWIEGEADAAWNEIDFGTWNELSPFVHEICVVDRE